MVRLNLLPPEIQEKRKFEHLIGYVAIAAVVVIGVIVVAYVFLAWQVSQKNDVLQANEETAAALQDQAEAYKVFEEKEETLNDRIAVADTALAGRVDWGRITNEISLVLPSDVWLIFLGGDEEDGMEFVGRAVDSSTDIPDVGHKAVAKTLVRLSDLDLLTNVWLDSSVKGEIQNADERIIEFAITTGVVSPATTTTQTASVPAPPDQTAP